MLGRRLAAATGTPPTNDLAPEDLGTVDGDEGTTAMPGSGRTTAAWSASNDTACTIG